MNVFVVSDALHLTMALGLLGLVGQERQRQLHTCLLLMMLYTSPWLWGYCAAGQSV